MSQIIQYLIFIEHQSKSIQSNSRTAYRSSATIMGKIDSNKEIKNK